MKLITMKVAFSDARLEDSQMRFVRTVVAVARDTDAAVEAWRESAPHLTEVNVIEFSATTIPPEGVAITVGASQAMPS